MTGRPTVQASIVLALALLGDSLLYAVLPLHAATFGVSLAWAGVLLSANHIVRPRAPPPTRATASPRVAGMLLVAIAIWLAGFAEVMQRTTVRRTG